jgi:hypothetical protein
MADERVREAYARRQEVSVFNWLGTLLLLALPAILGIVAGCIWKWNAILILGGVVVLTIIAIIVLMLLSKQSSKRNFMTALLVIKIVALILVILACAFFGSEIVAFVESFNAPVAELGGIIS